MNSQVNSDYIEFRIKEMNDAILLLRKLTSREYSDLHVYEKLALRYLVIQLVEAAASICLHILLNVFNESAESYPECFIRLGERGVIPRGLAEKLASATRLRNLLVHRYWVIVDEKVYESVKEGLRDFQEYIQHVRSLLRKD